uniref:Conserved hypothetical chloroplast protein Ycf12 n=1 Tax=Selaginella pallidissima TaxID=1715389 RepID=A0A7U3TX69_9TRAC|nr:conserved hypothetical chloroplast protein Ycf12 [Selaginella pallidissima]
MSLFGSYCAAYCFSSGRCVASGLSVIAWLAASPKG